MFGYLRLFSLVSSIAILIIALLVGLSFRSIATTDMRALVEKNSTGIAQGFINSVWQPHREQVVAVTPDPAGVAAFRQNAQRYFASLPMAQANLYSYNGSLLYSTDPAAQNVTAPTEAATTLSAGKVQSHLVSDFPGKDGAITVVQSWIPILTPDGRSIEGAVEIFYDVSNQWRKLLLLQFMSSGAIVLIFITLMWVLILTSKKAEHIISKQHEANIELTAAAAAAQAENREKSLFLANISHELRTPLNAIIGFSEIIQAQLMGDVPNAKYQGYVNDIHGSGVHLLSLINDILDFSKAEAGKLELELEETNATKLVVTCLRLVTPRAEGATVRLVNALPKEHLVMVTDAKKLKQVLLNLLSNAVKFTPQNGEVRVSAWQNVGDDTITFEVRDTGIGIAPKDIARAMAPFGQVDNTLSRKYEGTGLGLPLSKKFVELMGGKFHIESKTNEGTTITITLPRQSPQGKPARAAA